MPPLRGSPCARSFSQGSRLNGVNLGRFRRGRPGWSDGLRCWGWGEDNDRDVFFWRGGDGDWVETEFVLRQLQQLDVDELSGSHQRGGKETISGSLRMTTRTA